MSQSESTPGLVCEVLDTEPACEKAWSTFLTNAPGDVHAKGNGSYCLRSTSLNYTIYFISINNLSGTDGHRTTARTWHASHLKNSSLAEAICLSTKSTLPLPHRQMMRSPLPLTIRGFCLCLTTLTLYLILAGRSRPRHGQPWSSGSSKGNRSVTSRVISACPMRRSGECCVPRVARSGTCEHGSPKWPVCCTQRGCQPAAGVRRATLAIRLFLECNAWIDLLFFEHIPVAGCLASKAWIRERPLFDIDLLTIRNGVHQGDQHTQVWHL